MLKLTQLTRLRFRARGAARLPWRPLSSSSSPPAPAPPEKKEEQKRLPRLAPRAAALEFGLPPRAERWQLLGRQMRASASAAFDRRAVVVVAASASVVVGIGACEAQLLLAADGLGTVDSARFTLAYGLEQLLPSCTWATAPPELVARALGLDPDAVLLGSNGGASGAGSAGGAGAAAAAAASELLVERLAWARHLLASVAVVSQVVHMVSSSLRAARALRRRVRDGREPPLAGAPAPPRNSKGGGGGGGGGGAPFGSERVLRLCGAHSECTVALERAERAAGRRWAFVPVTETPWPGSDGDAPLRREPFYWCVGDALAPTGPGGAYSDVAAWAPIAGAWRKDWLLQTSTGKRVLYMEADTTDLLGGGGALDLGAPNRDLSIEHAAQGFRMAEALVAAQLEDSRSMPRLRSRRVLLGDSLQPAHIDSGFGRHAGLGTLRERVDGRAEADVFIDSRAPVFDALAKWCAGEVARAGSGIDTVVFDTANASDFRVLRALGCSADPPINVVDAAGAQQLVDEVAAAWAAAALHETVEQGAAAALPAGYEAAGAVGAGAKTGAATAAGAAPRELTVSQLPWIVYRSTTAASVNAAHSLAEAGRFENPAQCCVLLDTADGEELLRTLHARFGRQDYFTVCVPHIHNAQFQQVRDWTRQGLAPGTIQTELDTRNMPFIRAQAKAKANAEAATENIVPHLK